MEKVLFVSLFVTISIIITFFESQSIFAFNTGFETEQLTEKDKEKYLNSEYRLERSPVKYDHKTVNSFAVNEYDDIAIVVGKTSQSSDIIQIYDENGSFKYTLMLTWSNGAYLEWDDKNLVVTTDGYCLLVNEEGEILDVQKVVNKESKALDGQNYIYGGKNADYIYTLREKILVKNGVTYEMSRPILNNIDFLFGNYSTITKTFADGTTIVLHDCSKIYFVEYSLFLIMVILFPIICIFAVKQTIKKSRKT